MPLLQTYATASTIIPILAGLVAAQLTLALDPASTGGTVLGTAVRTALVVWLALSALEITAAMLRGDGLATAHAGTPGSWNAGRIALAGGVLIAAGLQRAPGRLLINLLGYVLLVTCVVWVVRRRGGTGAVARAATMVAMLAFVPTGVDLRGVAPLEQARANSPFRWTLGWPEDGWALRHEVALARPWSQRGGTIIVPLAQAYTGPARVIVLLNGAELGTMQQVDRTQLELAIPEAAISGQMRLTIELRQRPHDPALRLVAQRWASGASLGNRASSYFDGRTWHGGTFNDITGQAQPGAYVIVVGGPR